MKQQFLPSWSSRFSRCWFIPGASLPEMWAHGSGERVKQEGGTTQRLPSTQTHSPASAHMPLHTLSHLFSVLHPAKKTHDLHFQRQNLGVGIGAIKGDIKGGFHFSRVLITKDMDFHLIMINCRDSRTKTFVSLACHLRTPWPKVSHPPQSVFRDWHPFGPAQPLTSLWSHSCQWPKRSLQYRRRSPPWWPGEVGWRGQEGGLRGRYISISCLD